MPVVEPAVAALFGFSSDSAREPGLCFVGASGLFVTHSLVAFVECDLFGMAGGSVLLFSKPDLD